MPQMTSIKKEHGIGMIQAGASVRNVCRALNVYSSTMRCLRLRLAQKKQYYRQTYTWQKTCMTLTWWAVRWMDRHCHSTIAQSSTLFRASWMLSDIITRYWCLLSSGPASPNFNMASLFAWSFSGWTPMGHLGSFHPLPCTSVHKCTVTVCRIDWRVVVHHGPSYPADWWPLRHISTGSVTLIFFNTHLWIPFVVPTTLDFFAKVTKKSLKWSF